MLKTEQQSGKTCIDADGNVYKTVKIGDQWWMAENLKVTHYRNGDPIPNVTGRSEWRDLTTGAYCSYGNDESYVSTYGRLYNWFAVNDSRGLAPEGWHIPTDEEWKQLENFLGTDGGGRLKKIGTEHWKGPNTGANNESGFSALPGGYRHGNGSFSTIGYYANFWSATEYYGYYAWYRRLSYGSSDVSRNYFFLQNGFSVRCIRNRGRVPQLLLFATRFIRALYNGLYTTKSVKIK